MKYKVGSLVMLSAQGAKLEQNSEERGGFGIVVKYIANTNFPYKMRWFYKGTKKVPTLRGFGDTWDFGAKEYELKKMRAK